MRTLQQILEHQTEQRRKELREFNRVHSPIRERDIDGITYGVFRFVNGWFYGRKFMNGYHPEALIAIPEFVVEEIATCHT